MVVLIEAGKKAKDKREEQILSGETISDNECYAEIYVNLKMFSVAGNFCAE